MNEPDLHICDDSSKMSTKSCDCPPEYYCGEICGEGYSVGTYISWQHFPRSTSSRSRCDDSSESEYKSMSTTAVSVPKPESPIPSKHSSTEYPITKTFSQLNANHYLEIRHVFHLLNFMIGHLVCKEPDDPVEFLVYLLEDCLKFRDAFGEPPLLFTMAHVKSLYNAFDPFERGNLTVDQYREGLDSLGLKTGITKYNVNPPVNDEGNVEDTYFMFEAERCLLENLRLMLRIPKMEEENRVRWHKILAARERVRLKESLKSTEIEAAEGSESGDNQFCNCFGPKPNLKYICRCPRAASLRCEPEQLFLDK